MTGLDVVFLVLVGALLGLDVVSFPQAMISRPIVAATVGGAIAGSVALGLLVGVVLEMMAMETLPVGASRYPEWATASLVGGALAATTTGSGHAGVLVLASFAAIATAWVGGWSMYALRRLNGIWAKRALPALEAGTARTVVGLQLRGLGADLVRGALLTLLALIVWRPVMRWLVPHWSLGLTVSHAVVVALAAAVAGSAVWRLSHGATGARWCFVGGVVVGLALVVLR
jgi:PTS system mannose-specific IIC component